MNWLQFLQEKPVLTLARESLGDEEFLRFLQRIFRTKTPKGLSSTLAWHAFEEIGWPEGATYCHQYKADYSLQMLTKKNLTQQISPRLTLRQDHWKSNKEEHIQAHQILLDLLPEKAQEEYLLQELAQTSTAPQ
jgi:hypothetical protein